MHPIRPQAVHALIRSVAERHDHWFPRPGSPWDLFAFGVRRRSYTKADARFDDLICIAADDPLLGPQFFAWRGTTEPGSGTATVLAGHQFRGLYEPDDGWREGRGCMRQVGEILVERGIGQPLDRGYFGIHIHPPISDGLGRVGAASAGCQVTHTAAAYAELRAVVERQHLHGNGRRLSYVVYDLEKNPELGVLFTLARPV